MYTRKQLPRCFPFLSLIYEVVEDKMSKKCDNCSSRIDTQFVENEMLTIPYAAHQSAAARQERQIRRMWIALIVSVVVLFVAKVAFYVSWRKFFSKI
jgi:hypothetical protein